MNRIKLPIASIKVIDRQRTDLGDIADLADSLKRYGLIQPIILNQDNRLIAGERRLRAAQQLGWTEIDITYRETLSIDELHELELEENVRRKDMKWQERCLNIAKIHFLKYKGAYQNGQQWGQRETGALLNMSLGSVSQCLEVASELRNDPKSPMWEADSLTEALTIINNRNLALVEAELAKRQKAVADQQARDQLELKRLEAEVTIITSASDIPAADEQRLKYYSNPHNPPGSYEAYVKDKLRRMDELKSTIYLSNRFHNVDCIKFMNETDQRFAAIITDPPYAIDMDNLEQENVGMVGIDTVADEHEVDDNVDLLTKFFPAAWRVLNDPGFLVLCADQMLWQFLYNEAIKAGFAVQRWPLTWVKSHVCMNNAANYNYTKSTEIAMVCRKGNAQLSEKSAVSHLVAPHDEYKIDMRHPFVKPFKFWQFLIKHTTRINDLVLEPFAGHGSGVLSLLRMERNVVGCESNTEHYNALLENLRQYYKKQNPNSIFK